MKIKIGFLTYTVGTMDKQVAQAKRAFGYINHAAQTIELEAGLSKERYREVLLHEIVHGVYAAWDIQPGAEEDTVTKVSNGLATVFMDNPKLKEILF